MIGKEVLSQLKEEINDFEYERYLKQLQFVEEESKPNLAVFSAPNILIARWINTKYSSRIAYLYEQQSGTATKVKIILSSARKKTITYNTQAKIKKEGLIDPSATFDTFITGDSNRIPYNAALKIAQQQGAFNPLLIHGGTGLGKTHLLNAIANFVGRHKSVNFITSGEFMDEFVKAIRNKTMDKFKERFRSSDYLLIDDVQLLGKGEQVQNEFFQTFNELHSNKKQIVLTSDVHPKYLNNLDQRLKSRFVSGMICDICPPELDTKIAILKQRCEIDRIHINDDILYYIATNVNDDIRVISGLLIRINFAASIVQQEEITLELVKGQLQEYFNKEDKEITLGHIVEIVSANLNVKPSEITSKSRNKAIVNARRIVIYIARSLTPNSMPELAKFFNMKDHSSVSKSFKTIEKEIKANKEFKAKIEELKVKVKQKTNQNTL
ncbi:chromosomal replication initiator protein DnaA [Helicobacter monodelphidis]|uniref:chromosomal replication initiator protein DnaA n=1 Tax=Helicobacter sp. 15-1451 TaxID=2004995 RepID=UPI000DCF141B|nr:chromosomal replication initiator protein DnaA [Helicobacter sp. 15-1451]RAX56836.1 chromosomal replication initiator protein DnaA [Helicobacter sp. 15-1451]